MDDHVKEFYRQFSEDSPTGNFHKVIALHEAPDSKWKTICNLIPNLPKGWYELSKLSTSDRIDFTRDYWYSKLPFHPCMIAGLADFFSSLDDIGIFVTQKKFDDPFDLQMVYSLKGGRGFFHGGCPASDEKVLTLKRTFPAVNWPEDYLAFFQIHDGFSKATDTGITPCSHMLSAYDAFQNMLNSIDPVTTMKGDPVDATKLFPFYESFGMPFYQCFWGDWYPEEEMGNVYYSGQINKISDVTSQDPSVETMAFATFSDWLMFYLEIIEKP